MPFSVRPNIRIRWLLVNAQVVICVSNPALWIVLIWFPCLSLVKHGIGKHHKGLVQHLYVRQNSFPLNKLDNEYKMNYAKWEMFGGIHPPEHKQESTTTAIQQASLPERLIIPMLKYVLKKPKQTKTVHNSWQTN